MNERQKELLKILLTEYQDPLLIQELASRLDCSEKTVRNDLKQIDLYLREVSSGSIKRKPGVGITLEIDETERFEVLHLLLSTAPFQGKGERIIEIAFQLLTSNNPITIQAFVSQHYVAKTVIKKELDNIQHWLASFDLELISKPGLGHMIKGTELQKRQALSRLPLLVSTANRNYVLDLFLLHEITTVKKALRDLRLNYQLSFTDEAMESLLVHALIMLKRTRQKSPVLVPEEEKVHVFGQEEYRYAASFFKQLEAAFRISFPEDERVYFTWHLISGKVTESSVKDKLSSDDFLLEVVSSFTRKLSKLTLFPFEKDAVLESGLVVHMHSVINRIRYGFPITNPMLSEIKKMYPYMFSMVILTLGEVKQTYNLDIKEDEAAYLVLHFQASIERMEGSKSKRRKTLIVCHMGVGMSHLLEAKITQNYKGIEIAACVSKAEVDQALKKEQVDFIISTVPLEKVEVPYLVISPLLETTDKEKLSQFIDELDHKVVKNGGSSLQRLISKDLFFLGVDKEHRYEVVELLGNALIQKGYVKENFTHNALLRERKSATSIGGGIAIPHADPRLIHKSAIAVAILKDPIEWGNEFVSVVFLLAIANSDQKITREVIGQIAAISEDPTVAKELAETYDMESFISVLEK
ncbi:BglG family transcription antiterminator [Oceanobacillus polygoni]|uniref:Activator of the mannose operon (Transcriptional antiterminator) n=1 Tax=Oceanobacillus polygoni TaxID=1235259 RepID=A0A9X1CE67_9BACI|nr:BglG family transcription antiterminator [Oceanobacillus polygoni]MBP2075958.1 activator of the mannose operon (transcriptional antiterminator) [Oceanobacillus polygoni]